MRIRELVTKVPKFGTRRRVPLTEPVHDHRSDPTRSIRPTGSELDMLAYDLIPQVRHHWQHRTREQCWFVVYDGSRNRYGTHVRIHRLIPVHNSSSEPEQHFEITRGESERLLAPEMRVLGYLHTHIPGSGHGQWPSDDDHRSLPKEMIGGVYLLGNTRVHWYDRTRIIRSSPVFCPPVAADGEDGKDGDGTPDTQDGDIHIHTEEIR